MFGVYEDFDAACGSGLTTDEAEAFEGEDHLVNEHPFQPIE